MRKKKKKTHLATGAVSYDKFNWIPRFAREFLCVCSDIKRRFFKRSLFQTWSHVYA